MKLFLKILIISALLSCGMAWGFKNYKNPFASFESAEEISGESKEKSGDEKEDSLANISSFERLQSTNSLVFLNLKNEKKLANFLEEVPTSPPNV